MARRTMWLINMNRQGLNAAKAKLRDAGARGGEAADRLDRLEKTEADPRLFVDEIQMLHRRQTFSDHAAFCLLGDIVDAHAVTKATRRIGEWEKFDEVLNESRDELHSLLVETVRNHLKSQRLPASSLVDVFQWLIEDCKQMQFDALPEYGEMIQQGALEDMPSAFLELGLSDMGRTFEESKDAYAAAKARGEVELIGETYDENSQRRAKEFLGVASSSPEN
jgi:hypothetical protein